MAILVRFASNKWKPEQRLIRMQMLAKSMTCEKVASELISVLSMKNRVKLELLHAAMRDRASVNNCQSGVSINC